MFEARYGGHRRIGRLGALARVFWPPQGPAWPRPARASLTRPRRSAGNLAEVTTVARRPNTEADCGTIMQAAVDRYGGPDILVVASGLNDVSPIVDMTPERFEKVMQGNLTGAWLLCKAFGQRVIPQGARQGGPGVFGARKVVTWRATPPIARLEGSHRRPHQGLGLRVGQARTLSTPSPTVFLLTTDGLDVEDNEATATRNGMLARIPLGRLGEPEDLAGPLLFLARAPRIFIRTHPVRRRWLHRGLAMTSRSVIAIVWRRTHGPRHSSGLRPRGSRGRVYDPRRRS